MNRPGIRSRRLLVTIAATVAVSGAVVAHARQRPDDGLPQVDGRLQEVDDGLQRVTGRLQDLDGVPPRVTSRLQDLDGVPPPVASRLQTGDEGPQQFTSRLPAVDRGQQRVDSLLQQVEFGDILPLQLVTPGGGKGAWLWTSARVQLDLALYELDTPAFVERYRTLVPFEVNHIDLAGLARVAAWSTAGSSTSDYTEVHLPPGTQPGLYVLDVRGAGIADAQCILLYTDYGLVAKRGRDGVTVWVTSVPGGTPAPGAAVTLYDGAGAALATTTADGDGVGSFRGVGQGVFAQARVGRQEALVVLDRYWYSSDAYYWWWDELPSLPKAYVGHVHTDRPIYKPGHTAHYKATLRRIERSGYSVVPASTPITVTVKDAADHTIATMAATADAFGSVAGDVRIADEVATGTWRIEVAIGRETVYGSFQVEDYVKPDFAVQVSTDRPFYVRDDTAAVTVQADYYFGQAVTGADVTLRVYRDYYGGYGNTERPVFQASGHSGPDGAWTAAVSLPGSSSETEQYFFEAEVMDANRRPVVQEVDAPVHPAAFALAVRAERYGVEVGQAVHFDVSTMHHDGTPASGRTVDVRIERYARVGRVTVDTRTLATGADGAAVLRLDGLDEGWYYVTATASDGAGHRVEARAYAWVFNRLRAWYWWGDGEVEVRADRASYAPGETAHLFVVSPVTTTALVTIEREDVYEEIVVPVAGTTIVDVPIRAEYAPGVVASVQLWSPNELGDDRWENLAEGTMLGASVALDVPAEDRRLSVQIDPDAVAHAPREAATFTVAVRDASGRPVEAQLSFALVDKAVLALAADPSGDIFDAFWQPRSSSVSTFDSLRPSQRYAYGPGLPDLRPRPGEGPTTDPAGQGDAGPRRDFPDTAYWRADIVTGPDGMARITLTLPDSLTTWQATARAVTLGTEVGQGSAELVVTQAIIAEPVLPRYAVQGDSFALDVLARNYAGGTLDATCTLDSPGLVQLDPGVRSMALPVNETRSARWTVVASRPGESPVTARLTTSAGDDAVELPIEVHPFAVPDRRAISGVVRDVVTETVEVPFNAVPEASSVELLLSPSVAVSVIDGLGELIDFPYGCVEQTMSRLMPNAVIGRLILELDIQPLEIIRQLPDMMALGLQKLYGFQHEDGSWGWWSGTQNIYITSWVLHGLALTEQAGYVVDPDVLDRGLRWLAATLPAEPDVRLRVYGAYVLALAGRGNEALVLSLYRDRAGLDAFSVAALAVALDMTGHHDLATIALDDLRAMAVQTPTGASWPLTRPPGNNWAYYWQIMASTEKNTAMALIAFARFAPDDPLAAQAARWLIEHRSGPGWSSTHATAFAVMALTDYVAASGELWATYDWTALWDGVTIGSGRVEIANRGRIPPMAVGSAALTPGQHALTIRKGPDGALYYALVARMVRYLDGFAAESAAGEGIALSRQYTPIAGRSDARVWRVGDIVNVRLTVDVTDTVSYAIIEDRPPAGLEPLNDHLATESTRVPGTDRPWHWSDYERKDIRADRVTFFATTLGPGQHTFDYAARAVTPGVFGARPAEVYAMYRPAIWARSASDRVTIDPERIADRPPLAGDLDRDCRLTTFDAALVAAAWPAAAAAAGRRDLTGDGDVDVADIGTAVGRSGLECGDAVPMPPGDAGDIAVRLRAPEVVRTGEAFTVDLVVDGQGDVGGYDVTVTLPHGVVDVLGARRGDLIPAATLLGPTVNGDTIRFGGYALRGAAARTEAVLGRLRLRPWQTADVAIRIVRAQVVTARGAEYRVSVSGAVVSPEPWLRRGLYLPHVGQDAGGADFW